MPPPSRRVHGTESWRAPEVYAHHQKGGPGYNAFAADAWSVGVAAYCLYLGSMPFDHGPLQNQVPFIRLQERRTLRVVCQHYGSAIVARWDALSANEQCMLEGLLQPDPSRRWNMTHIKHALLHHEVIEAPVDGGMRYRSASAPLDEGGEAPDEPAAPLVPVRRQRGGPIGLVRKPRLATPTATEDSKPQRKSKRGREE